MTFSVVIATHNRAADLRATLASLAGLQPAADWELIVVDNNSTDATPAVVEAAAREFPAPLRYLFEREPGRSAALNAGIRAARGAIVATTDDDVRVPPDWLDRAAAGLERFGCDYVGGRVLPIWGGPRPAWLPERGGRYWAVIALLDYGPDALELVHRMPLGVNMAFRREAFERAGLWNPSIGRRAGTLLGQEVREWCVRARAAGLRGFYVPDLAVRHVIPAERLTKRYFRRWYYWRGISRALLYAQTGLDMDAPQKTSLDFSRVPHVFGIPRYLYRKAIAQAWLRIRDAARRNYTAAFEHELWLCFFVGLVRQRWRDSGQVPSAFEHDSAQMWSSTGPAPAFFSGHRASERAPRLRQ